MSSTDSESAQLALLFHEEQLKPAAEQIPGPHFPLSPDREGATSYWEEREDGLPPIVAIEEDQIEALLRAKWAGEPHLGKLVPGLLKLAEDLKTEEEVEEDLDPYIYRMF